MDASSLTKYECGGPLITGGQPKMYESSEGKFVRLDAVRELFKRIDANDLRTALRVYTVYKEEHPQRNDIDPAYYFEKWIEKQLKTNGH